MSDRPGRIEELAEEGLRALEAAQTESALLEIKGRYFGKKGALTEYLKGVSMCPPGASGPAS